MFGNVKVPPGDPPIYPIEVLPEQAEQESVFAPPARVDVLASASKAVSTGPTEALPWLRIQFT
jgi:hypothetical protein